MPSPSLPGPRIAYDLDGSFGFISKNIGSDFVPTDLPANALTYLNADAQGGLVVPNTWWDIVNPMPRLTMLSLVFPVPTHLLAWFTSARSRFSSTNGVVTTIYDVGVDVEFQTSKDTTNGLDGSWETISTKYGDDVHLPFSSEGQGMRPDGTLSDVPESNTNDNRMWSDSDKVGDGWKRVFGPGRRYVRGIRLFIPRKPAATGSTYHYSVMHLHLYGMPDTTVTADRLVLLDPVTAEPLTQDIHYGDVDFKNESLRSIKVKNTSAGSTAYGVTLATASGYRPGSPDSKDSIQLSLDGDEWGPDVVVGDLAPGGVSSEVFVRLDPSDGTIGQRFVRLVGDVEEWL